MEEEKLVLSGRPPLRTDSPYRYYARVFDLPLKDAVILDLGAGIDASFGNAPENKDNIVISLSPEFAIQALSQYRYPERHTRSIAAFAQKLPFRDNSFDVVVSAMAIPAYLPEKDKIQVYRQVTNVLKPGGYAQFFPVTPAEITQAQEVATEDISVEHHTIPDSLAYRIPENLFPDDFIEQQNFPVVKLPRLTIRKKL